MKKKISSTGEIIFMMFLKDVFEPTDLLLFCFLRVFTVLCCSKSENALQLFPF